MIKSKNSLILFVLITSALAGVGSEDKRFFEDPLYKKFVAAGQKCVSSEEMTMCLAEIVAPQFGRVFLFFNNAEEIFDQEKMTDQAFIAKSKQYPKDVKAYLGRCFSHSYPPNAVLMEKNDWGREYFNTDPVIVMFKPLKREHEPSCYVQKVNGFYKIVGIMMNGD